MTAQLSVTSAFGSGEVRLLRLAIDLGAAETGGPLSTTEELLVRLGRREAPTSEADREAARSAILAGEDPLGGQLCRIRPAADRRAIGAFYTPPALVDPMLDWALAQGPSRVVDAGCGSGRFAAEVVRRAPELSVIAVDLDPVATLLTRAALAVLGARAGSVLQADYTALELARIAGRTAFVGNPPYVRHHELPPEAKARAIALGRRLGHSVSGLAGLHAHFYLATAEYAAPGDVGCFVTSAEWLDVGYGSVIRELLLNGLGGQSLHVIDPQAVPFDDAMATAAIACFVAGAPPESIRCRIVNTPGQLQDLNIGRPVRRNVLAAARRWTPLLRAQQGTDGAASEATAPGYLWMPLFRAGRGSGHEPGRMPLREIARVHRGVVTGANDFFILTRDRARQLGLAAWCRPAITRGEEVLRAYGVVRDSPERRLLLDIPPDVDRLAHPQLDAYLKRGEFPRGSGPAVAQGYIASRRRPWWRLGVPPPPPIIVSYMARQAPAFALNPDRLALVNVAHGLYPVRPLDDEQLAALVAYLNGERESFRGSGRTYYGGLEKFEPGELEALLIPADGLWAR